MAMKKPRCQPEALARKLNAAPVLYASTRLKKAVTARASGCWKLTLIQNFVSWSSSTTSVASAYQGASLRMRPRFAGSVQIGHATAADARMLRLGADVGTIVPAALTLGMRAGRYDNAFIG